VALKGTVSALLALWPLVALICAQGQTKPASLRETLQWMKDTAPSHIGYLSTEIENGTWRLHWEYGNPSQCDIKATVTSHEVAREDGSVYEDDTVFIFNLNDIDPKSVSVTHVPGVLGPETGIMFETKNELPNIACKTVIKTKGEDYGKTMREADGKDRCNWGMASSSYVGFDFQSISYAKRFARALRHAVELCGGKPSPF
jgi:hypothetical protein